jgi:membrane fusion protein (multidrug efflux system)
MEPVRPAITNLKVLGSIALKQEIRQEPQPLQLKDVEIIEGSPSTDSVPPKDNTRRSFKRVVWSTVAVMLIALATYYANVAYKHVSTHEETDDAYITGHLHQVSTRIDGTVDQVLVDDNEHVKKGQVLVILDPRDYQTKAAQALANLDQAEKQAQTAQTTISFQDTSAAGQDINAKGSVSNAVAAIARSKSAVREASANINASVANLNARQAELERAELDYHRFQYLVREGAVSASQGDAAKRDYVVALQNRNSAKDVVTQANERFAQTQESVRTSEAELTKAQAQVLLAKASSVQTNVNRNQYEANLSAVAAAKAALEQAQLNLSYTKILAPSDGRVGKKTVEEGQRIEPGQPLLTIVSDDLWVVANYKETQLKTMRPGQPVEIKIDSFPDHKFQGSVLSFSPASGSSFSVLPSDNATGNFTKIVQRVAVKILLNRDSVKGFEDRIAPGMSVISSIDVRDNSTNQKLAGLRP